MPNTYTESLLIFSFNDMVGFLLYVVLLIKAVYCWSGMPSPWGRCVYDNLINKFAINEVEGIYNHKKIHSCSYNDINIIRLA